MRASSSGEFASRLPDLVGTYSNPEIQERLRRLSEKLERLAASDATPLPSARPDRKLRSGLIPQAIMRVLGEPVEPMQARDIHAEVEAVLGRAVSPSGVKNWLANHARGDRPLFVRLGRGRYVLATADHPPGLDAA
jgi:hypothetical protein